MEEISIKEKYINNLFKNTSASYKFFWFKAILNNLQDSQISTIKFNTLVNEMICLAWPIVVGQKRKLGNKDAIEEVIEYISNYVLEKDDGHIWPIEDLRDYLKITMDKEIMSKKRKAIENVPYRFLSPFLVDFNESAWRLSKPELVAVLSGKPNVMYKIGSYADLETNIYIYPDWAIYLKANKEKLIEYTDKELDKYLKKKETEIVNVEEAKEQPQEDIEMSFPNAQPISFEESVNIKVSNYSVKPCVVTVAKRAYRVSSWFEAFKIIMFYNCDKNKKLDWDNLNEDINKVKTTKGYKYILNVDEETDTYVKFFEELYVHSFKHSSNNIKELTYFINSYGLKFNLYFAVKNEELSEEEFLAVQNSVIEDLVNNQKCKEKNTKYYIARINGRVLSKEEKFYKRIEKEFDSKILIGDIVISEEEDKILNTFMRKRLNEIVTTSKLSSQHDKVFAYGLVVYAIKYYQKNIFWPHFKTEYEVSIPVTKQVLINTAFEKIIKKYNKPYIDSEGKTSYVQNVAMHAFVCNKCADQLFDYIFDFWRVDLSRSIENCIDDAGNNIFDILIEEIEGNNNTQVQDVMLHTTMALKANPRGCKNRYRRILNMIDSSYWNNTDYSSSSNRITVLFNEWKNKSSSAFAKEIKKDVEGRKHGRGDKLLSRPTILHNIEESAFSMFLPKQILRGCTEEEYPKWEIKIGSQIEIIEPELLAGKASLYSGEYTCDIDPRLIFDEYTFTLLSDRRVYARFTTKAEDIRFFNAKGRCVDHSLGYVQKETVEAFAKIGSTFDYIDHDLYRISSEENGYDAYSFECEEGDVFILPNGHAVSVGKPLNEGLLDTSLKDGVVVNDGTNNYRISTKLEKIFFKASQKKLNGSSIKISKNGNQLVFGRIVDNKYKEFKIEETIDDIYGYLIDLNDYIKEQGCFDIEINIPGYQIKKYSICYIKGFDYKFVDAPYVFKESGTFEIPSYFNVDLNSDWQKEGAVNSLVFSLDESGREEKNKYVKNRKLYLPLTLNNQKLELCFDIPALYWKYKADEEWSYSEPAETTIKDLPSNIYVDYYTGANNVTMYVDDEETKDESLTKPSYNKEKQCYYFKTVDLKESLTRDKDFRRICVSIGNNNCTFLNVACRSIVKSSSITADFYNHKIYGNFDIEGSNEYMVQLLHGDEVIEQDIPVEKGYFEIECDVEEGKYTIVLNELEEDDSGFGSVSFELGRYDQLLVDVNNLENKKLIIQAIKYRDNKYAPLRLSHTYRIRKLKKLDYHEDIEDKIDIHSWLHDSTDPDEMSKFTYYKGLLGCMTFSGYKDLMKVLVMFDDYSDINSALVYLRDGDEAVELLHDAEKRSLIASDEKLPNHYRRRCIKTLDDEIFKINIDIIEGAQE